MRLLCKNMSIEKNATILLVIHRWKKFVQVKKKHVITQYQDEWEGVIGVGDMRGQAVVSQLLKPPGQKAGWVNFSWQDLWQVRWCLVDRAMTAVDDDAGSGLFWQEIGAVTGIPKWCSWPCSGDRSVTSKVLWQALDWGLAKWCRQIVHVMRKVLRRGSLFIFRDWRVVEDGTQCWKNRNLVNLR